MKERDKALFEPFPFWEQLKLPAEDGKMRETDCANTEGLLRIIQNIPSSKVEPLKRWLARQEKTWRKKAARKFQPEKIIYKHPRIRKG